MRQVHDFKKSVKYGDDGEYDVIDAWPDLFTIYPGEEYDLDVFNGKTFELKNESSYTLQPGFPKPHIPTSTINFFIEVIGNKRRGNPGGPFRAYNDNINFYAHLFAHPSDRVLFLFRDLETLCDRCNMLIALLPKWNRDNPIPIYNTRHITLGYALPIKEFEDLFVKIKLGEDIEKYL